MKKLTLLTFFLCFSLLLFSQIKFEEGYFINNNGVKTECFIKNIDWKNNPTKFKYKISENGKVQTGDILHVSEFSASNLRYSRFTTQIDTSGVQVSELSYNKKPEFKAVTIFLKYLVEGDASIFIYEKGSLRRYFYSMNGNNAVQLIYKKYKISVNEIRDNIEYIQQLWGDLKCENITINDFQNISYKRKDLVNLFVKYNDCQQVDFINFDEQNRRSKFHLSLRPGMNYSTIFFLVEQSNKNIIKTSLPSESSFRIGLELEMVLPYNKSKWAIIFEPTFQYYKADSDVNLFNSTYISHFEVDYSSLEIPIGIRYYFLLNEKVKIFINLVSVVDISLKSNLSSERADYTDLKAGLVNRNFAGGFGVNLNKKYSFEVRYGSRKLLFLNAKKALTKALVTDYRNIYLTFGYSFF